MPKPRATQPTKEVPQDGTTLSLLLNPVLAEQGTYPLLRLDERRQELEAKGVELFDFGTGDPREPTDGEIRQALIDGVPEVSRYPSTQGKRVL
ncbi:MAG: hypothetical protein ACRDTR_19530, partial [Rubrobacter sp.]